MSNVKCQSPWSLELWYGDSEQGIQFSGSTIELNFSLNRPLGQFSLKVPCVCTSVCLSPQPEPVLMDWSLLVKERSAKIEEEKKRKNN